MRTLNFIFFLFLLQWSGCGVDSGTPIGTKVLLNSVYGPHERNKLDAYLPEERDRSTKMVLMIHGGGWVAGDKSADGMYDIRNRLIEQGFAVSSMNYRYACGDFHKQMEDVQMAIDHIVANSANWNIGDKEFGIMGGSAGGHLALLFAHAYDSLNVVKAVVSIVGPTDLTDTLFYQYASNYNIAYVFEQLLGATIQADPQVYTDASPLFNYSNVPSLFIHGRLDNLVPFQQSVRMFDTLTAHRIIADTAIFSNADHNVFGPNLENREQVISEVAAWMNRFLKD